PPNPGQGADPPGRCHLTGGADQHSTGSGPPSAPWQSAAVRREGAPGIGGEVTHRCPCPRQSAGEVEKGVRAALVLQVRSIHAVLPETTRVPPGIVAHRVETGNDDARR